MSNSTPRGPDFLAYVHFRAINWRCHLNNVSGVMIVAISLRVARPTRYARAASRRRSSSVRRSRLVPSWAAGAGSPRSGRQSSPALGARASRSAWSAQFAAPRGLSRGRAYSIGTCEKRRPSRGTLRARAAVWKAPPSAGISAHAAPPDRATGKDRRMMSLVECWLNEAQYRGSCRLAADHRWRRLGKWTDRPLEPNETIEKCCAARPDCRIMTTRVPSDMISAPNERQARDGASTKD